jgi:hypothetical protein
VHIDIEFKCLIEHSTKNGLQLAELGFSLFSTSTRAADSAVPRWQNLVVEL